MITWADACEAVGYTYSCWVNTPRRVEVYYAYKDGVVEAFDTKEEAKVYSKDIDHSYTRESLLAYTTFIDGMCVLEQQANNYWYDALRKEYKELNDKVFDLCYGVACDRGGSRDDVASHVEVLMGLIMRK